MKLFIFIFSLIYTSSLLSQDMPIAISYKDGKIEKGHAELLNYNTTLVTIKSDDKSKISSVPIEEVEEISYQLDNGVIKAMSKYRTYIRPDNSLKVAHEKGVFYQLYANEQMAIYSTKMDTWENDTNGNWIPQINTNFFVSNADDDKIYYFHSESNKGANDSELNQKLMQALSVLYGQTCPNIVRKANNIAFTSDQFQAQLIELSSISCQ